ncbi:MAG: hypothetical protein MUF18_01850 [Fimbriiglobus sp.]|nr:hypothetical protein [Fimbriiglobus sp.]
MTSSSTPTTARRPRYRSLTRRRRRGGWWTIATTTTTPAKRGEEARRAKESRGIHFTPGILLGVGMFFFGITLFVVLLCLGYLSIWPLVFAGVGAVRAVLSFLGQGVD